MKTIEDLERLAHHNVVVRHFLMSWRTGLFTSLEQCLISLTMALADQNQRFIDAEVKRAMAAPPQPFIVQGGKPT